VDARGWEDCDDPEQLFVALRGRLPEGVARRLACAFCQRLWDRLEGECRIGREVIEVAERFAEGVAPREAIEALWLEFSAAHTRSHRKLGREDPLEPVRYLFPGYEPEWSMRYAAKAVRQAMPRKERATERVAQAAIIKGVCGNPFSA
jgi:hypothetical protein